jgi:hypothetical protein
MLQKKRSTKKKSLRESVSAGDNVKISLEGLAFCYLNANVSKINFLSHVPFHKLNLTVKQKRRDSEEVIFSLETKINSGHTVSIKTENAVTPDDIIIDGTHPFKELINISGLHKRKVNKKVVPPKLTPITLSIDDCAFYTAQMTTDRFDIIENDGTSGDVIIDTKKIGYVMGGKIECNDTGGNITIEAKGPQPFKVKRPMSDADGEFVYDITLSNHCVEMENCRELMKDDSDFRFYYDVLEDSVNPNRKFNIKKASTSESVAESIEVAACNIVIVQPLPPPPG